MRRAAILLIQAYRSFWPRRLRRACLFRRSCSAYVLEGLESYGLDEGLRRLRSRLRTCRPGCRRLEGQAIDAPLFRLANGSVVDAGALSDSALRDLGAD